MGCDIHAWLEWRRGPGRPWRADTRRGSWLTDSWWDAPAEDEHPNRYDLHEMDEGYEKGKLDLSRDYLMFALMAGVRDYEDVRLYEARGLPDDVSDVVFKQSQVWADWHSHSWLRPSELQLCLERASEIRLGHYIREDHDLRVIAAGSDDYYRLVFWFDN